MAESGDAAKEEYEAELEDSGADYDDALVAQLMAESGDAAKKQYEA